MGTEISVSRREWMKRSLIVSSGVVGLLAGKEALAELCHKTLPQGEGPFYPEQDLNRDNDLTRLEESSPSAVGQVIFVTGKVTDANCTPIPGALVEIWQACYSGKYNHSEDKHTLKLDPHFQYWGRARTNQLGNYVFKSIIPGHYPNGGGTFRPPHIHFKVHAAGFVSLTTQMYFHPDSYEDLELKKVVAKWNDYEQVSDSLKVLFTRQDPFGQVKSGNFDIALARI